MSQKQSYGMEKKLSVSYAEAVSRTKAAMQAEGFGVMSEIDVKEKLKEKLGVNYKNYLILGMCNPPLAYKALQAEPEIGLLLPCNVIVYDADGGGTVVSAVDPDSMLGVAGENAALQEIARDAKGRLERAMRAIKAS